MTVSSSNPSTPEPGYGPRWNQLLAETGWWHSFELPDGRVINGVQPLAAMREKIAQFAIPEDLTGRRVLDIGCWDGWFSFEMERRGADVLAIDAWDNPRFREMHAVYNSRVEYRQLDVNDLSPASVGFFDVVIFLGVLYHLKHPLQVLEKVCSVTRGMAAVESWVLRDNLDLDAQPVMQFYENDEFEGQTDNWCAPNRACLAAMCRTAGFARVEPCGISQYAAAFACYRQWLPLSDAGRQLPAPQMISALHATNFGVNCSPAKDDYLSITFTTPETRLTRDDVQPNMGPYGGRPISVTHCGADKWQANVKVSPGLQRGWHPVTVAVRGGPQSEAARIAIDMPLNDVCEPKIVRVCDGVDWTPDRLNMKNGRIICVWIAGLPENADRNNVQVLINGVRGRNDYVGPDHGSRQVNVEVTGKLALGEAVLVARVGRSESSPARLNVAES